MLKRRRRPQNAAVAMVWSVQRREGGGNSTPGGRQRGCEGLIYHPQALLASSPFPPRSHCGILVR
jgi:hypothetical protein